MDSEFQLLRLVVASPSDVSAEREIVPRVAEEINSSIAADRRVRLEVIRWETDAHPGFHPSGPQGLIDPILRIEDSDLLIGIFWKRFGTATADSLSGTEHEIRLAFEAWKKKRRPQIFVYFNEKSATPSSQQDAEQWGRVLRFKEDFPVDGLWWPYKRASQFERLLRTHLTSYLRHRFPTTVSGDHKRPPSNTDGSSDYFTVQKEVIEGHAHGYTGRRDARDFLKHFLNKHTCGYVFICGYPGQGKTAFCSDLIRRYGYVHHLAGISGGRNDVRLILRSLLSQIPSSVQYNPRLPDSLQELSKLWEETLIFCSKIKPIVILLDGLDELPKEEMENLGSLLPERLSPGVFVILALRPGQLLDVIRDHTSSAGNETYELGPLASEDIELILRNELTTVTEAALNRIKAAAMGSPLYVRSLINELRVHPDFELSDLPPTLEGLFRRATHFASDASAEGIRRILGLLSVTRKPLSIAEMQQMTQLSHRDIHEGVVHALRPFLVETSATYRFYHRAFLEFVVHKLLFPEELISAHAMIAAWLQGPQGKGTDYYWQYLAHHLLESGDHEGLEQEISAPFLIEKSRRYGYAVLEDIDCVITTMLAADRPSAVEKCVNLVEGLKCSVGEAIIRDASHKLSQRGSSPGPADLTFQPQETPAIPGLDIYIRSTAGVDVSADFYEIVPTNDGCSVAIGDAPGTGLKSAFVGRFIGHLFRRRLNTKYPASSLEDINFSLSTFDYFERISMQCMHLDLVEGVFTISNAGHPALAHFSKRRGKCDPLWVPGELLHDSTRQTHRLSYYENYRAEVDTGDVLVMLTDGLLEYHRLDGNAYGYRFTRLVEDKADLTSKDLGEAIIDDWRTHSAGEEHHDDALLVVISVRDRSLYRRNNAHESVK